MLNTWKEVELMKGNESASKAYATGERDEDDSPDNQEYSEFRIQNQKWVLILVEAVSEPAISLISFFI